MHIQLNSVHPYQQTVRTCVRAKIGTLEGLLHMYVLFAVYTCTVVCSIMLYVIVIAHVAGFKCFNVCTRTMHNARGYVMHEPNYCWSHDFSPIRYSVAKTAR